MPPSRNKAPDYCGSPSLCTLSIWLGLGIRQVLRAVEQHPQARLDDQLPLSRLLNLLCTTLRRKSAPLARKIIDINDIKPVPCSVLSDYIYVE
ncbi:hypothetical protein C4D60_Mb03t16190 [Musa balbisiana]|uniref:Uncharacterized protein n=1 Tax=Musa balbisiana TaxID=52838 RepID=A0A4S8JAC6_MUSBA|nr:hypothetical protein C4D60_Mb03t16190 [Musa balbisiana]